MSIDRRMFLAAGAAVTALPFAGAFAAAPSGSEMRTRAQSLLDALDEPQRAAALFGFHTPNRLAWNFMTGSRRAPGLALEQMTPAQKDLALDLLATAASAPGLEKAMNIMLQQDILRDEWGKGSADRNRERFSVQLYGLPSETGTWAWRWEGHHLSLSFTLLDDQVISTTPSSYSSEPNTVPSGPYRGLVVLKEEEALARALYSGLSDTARQRALVWPRSPGNILSNGGTERTLAAELAGIALGDLPQDQADMAARLVEVYTTEVLPAPMAAAQTGLNAQQDMTALRFAWGGADLDGSIYYRLTGQDILIEFASLRDQPLHLHAVFHDTARNFGRHLI
ncbi:DUF3500 domain-containing protein [Ruegeria hyattellae]|uniref:DUF3500 domain-containing protein n=1 Tax=Ruegeria hyattellae TaxID=3233337 RepID=UPI00355BA9DD